MLSIGNNERRPKPQRTLQNLHKPTIKERRDGRLRCEPGQGDRVAPQDRVPAVVGRAQVEQPRDRRWLPPPHRGWWHAVRPPRGSPLRPGRSGPRPRRPGQRRRRAPHRTLMGGRGRRPVRLTDADRAGTRASGPVRTCVGCRRSDSRSVLLRVVAEPRDEGNPAVVPDQRRRLPGRGAWLHPDIACLELAVRRRALSRALRCRVEVTDALRAWIEEMAQSTASVRTATESGFDADEHPMSTQQ